MDNLKFKGFQMIDGTKPDFNLSNLENGYVYFIRTDEKGESGYVYFNKRKYGLITDINAGEY